jgi:uncharacterized protein
MDSDFMAHMAQGLCSAGIEVVRFEFPYMAERRHTGTRRPPNPFPQIVAAYEAQISAWRDDRLPLFAAGKSMGGRAAASVQSADLSGVVVYGYPLHPAAKPERLRLEPLRARQTDLLIVQGERDKLGSAEAFAALGPTNAIAWCWLADGDHDLKPRKSSGLTHRQHLASAMAATVAFIEARQ